MTNIYNFNENKYCIMQHSKNVYLINKMITLYVFYAVRFSTEEFQPSYYSFIYSHNLFKLFRTFVLTDFNTGLLGNFPFVPMFSKLNDNI